MERRWFQPVSPVPHCLDCRTTAACQTMVCSSLFDRTGSELRPAALALSAEITLLSQHALLGSVWSASAGITIVCLDLVHATVVAQLSLPDFSAAPCPCLPLPSLSTDFPHTGNVALDKTDCMVFLGVGCGLKYKKRQ